MLKLEREWGTEKDLDTMGSVDAEGEENNIENVQMGPI
jgi:hypothetical protein